MKKGGEGEEEQEHEEEEQNQEQGGDRKMGREEQMVFWASSNILRSPL